MTNTKSLSTYDEKSVINRFIEELNNNEFKLDIEPQIGPEFECSKEYIEQRLQSYSNFLKSDLCKKIFEFDD